MMAAGRLMETMNLRMSSTVRVYPVALLLMLASTNPVLD
jgi:hypothetical protein